MSRFELVSAIKDLVFEIGDDRENTLDFINECIDDMKRHTEGVIADMEALREEYCLDNGICPNCESEMTVREVPEFEKLEFQGKLINNYTYVRFCPCCGENF